MQVFQNCINRTTSTILNYVTLLPPTPRTIKTMRSELVKRAKIFKINGLHRITIQREDNRSKSSVFMVTCSVAIL